MREKPPKRARAARVWTFMMTTGLDRDWRKAIAIIITPLGDAGKKRENECEVTDLSELDRPTAQGSRARDCERETGPVCYLGR